MLMLLVSSAASLSSSICSSSTAADAYLDRYPSFMIKKIPATMGGIIPKTKPLTLNVLPFMEKILGVVARQSRREKRMHTKLIRAFRTSNTFITIHSTITLSDG